MYRYDSFGSDAIFCVEKNGTEISELLFFIDQLMAIRRTGNNLLENSNSKLNKAYSKSNLLNKEMENLIVETIKTIDSSYIKLQGMVKQKENQKLQVDFNLFSYLDLDM